jgi:soluble lytic murein transglycosylase-like protein
MKRTFGVVAMMAFFFPPFGYASPQKPKTQLDQNEARLNYIHTFVEDAAAEFALEPALIRAVIKVESNFNHKAVSPVGARGLMQLMPPTAESMELREALNSKRPRVNVRAGTKYLRAMINRFHGDLELALAAYNAGPATVERYQGIPPFPETQNYVKKVLREVVRERKLIASTFSVGAR